MSFSIPSVRYTDKADGIKEKSLPVEKQAGSETQN
jgi:hypothetical protein